jgi:NADH:ubiquinone oxidoreductase subunit E
MAGLSDIFTELHKILKIDPGETTPDGLFTLETTECLGQCDNAPALTVDEAIYGNLTAKKIRAVLQEYIKKRSGARRKKR